VGNFKCHIGTLGPAQMRIALVFLASVLAPALCAANVGIHTHTTPWQQYGGDPARTSNSHVATKFPGR
jgi:hypothetical protein